MGAGLSERSVEGRRNQAHYHFKNNIMKMLCCYKPLKKPFKYKCIFTVPELHVSLKGYDATRDAPAERHHGVLWGQHRCASVANELWLFR